MTVCANEVNLMLVEVVFLFLSDVDALVVKLLRNLAADELSW